MSAAKMAHHLVSRAIDVTKEQYNVNDGEKTVHQVSAWAVMLIFTTIALYMAMLSMVSRLATPSTANNRQG